MGMDEVPESTSSLFDQGEDRILVLAPTGDDAELVRCVLERESLNVRVVGSVSELCAELLQSAGAVLVTEEALGSLDCELLRLTLADQEAWSDVPILLLAAAHRKVFPAEEILDRFASVASISILERPFRTKTLLSAVRVALRSRERQYEVRKLLRSQERALRQRDDFLSIVSHELKTPLTSLKLQTQIRRRFLSRGDDRVFHPEKVLAFIETTENQVQRLMHLVDDMLDVSRVETGTFFIERTAVDLNAMVGQVLGQLAGAVRSSGCAIQVRSGCELNGNWDRHRLEQVVANLITNALKYGRGRPVFVETAREGSCAVFRVQDEGIGIAVEDQERIFRRFERAVSGTGISGLGLGLYVTRETLKLHGGDISVQSEAGRGSVFTVRLPFEAPLGERLEAGALCGDGSNVHADSRSGSAENERG